MGPVSKVLAGNAAVRGCVGAALVTGAGLQPKEMAVGFHPLPDNFWLFLRKFTALHLPCGQP
jgi:hypothetical protein